MKKKKRLLPKILLSIGISLLVFIISIIVVAEIPTSTTVTSGCNDYSSFLRDSVTLNSSLYDTPITEISLLGSHDAFSNDISFSSMPNSSEENIVNNGFMRFIAEGAMVRYSRAQHDDPYLQGKAGVRYFDVRITNVNGIFYNSHGLISNTLQTNIRKIIKFFK